MKTTALGRKLARLHSGIGAAIAYMAMARGLDKAVVEAAMGLNGEASRARVRHAKRKGTSGYRAHAVNASGSKLARKAAEGRITHRHSV